MFMSAISKSGCACYKTDKHDTENREKVFFHNELYPRKFLETLFSDDFADVDVSC